MPRAVKIPCIGGPHDGLEREHQIMPIDGSEWNDNAHCYVFSFAEWSWNYTGRWQHVEHVGEVITFRTYRELMQRLGQLLGQCKITAEDSLAIQGKVKAKNLKAFIKYEANHGSQLL